MATIDGSWQMTAQTPVGERTFLARLASEGDQVTGSVFADNQEHLVEDGRLAGDEISWVVKKAVMGMDLRFTVVVTGDELSGTVKAGMLGTMAVRGARADSAE